MILDMMLEMIYDAWIDIWCLKWYMMLEMIYDAWNDI